MNDDDFVRILEKLQRKIEYGEEQTYYQVVIREYRNTTNFGILDDTNLLGAIKGPCGDTMKINLAIKNCRLLKASFWIDGCGAKIACGSMLTKIIRGKTLQEANDISNLQLFEAFKVLPMEHYHCTILSTNTLQRAIKNYNKKSNFSVKK